MKMARPEPERVSLEIKKQRMSLPSVLKNEIISVP
jgi:hypothetical protein